MAKQYKTWELIKAWQEGERGKFADSQNGTIVILTNKSIIISGGCIFYITSEDLTITWTKVQEPVDFMTAINSGKRIKPEPNSLDYNHCKWWLRHMADCYPADRIRELINGKWLIEDGE